jgi:ACR3 family arsenite transporter
MLAWMPKTLISKERLERDQIPIYAAALLVGVMIGLASPSAGSALEAAIYPVLGILLYATFLQVPFSELRSAAASGRFLATTLVLNFLIVPVVVFILSRFVAGEPAVLIVLPLVLAIGTQCLKARRSAVGALASRWDSVMGYLPVPFLALTLLAVVASQIPKLEGAFGQVLGVVPIYVAFLGVMALLGRVTARLFFLGVEAGRALIFTGATRNSLVVLPLALALPDAYALTPAIVVTQTLVELVGMLVYIRVIPGWVLPAAASRGS